jgi:DNA-binding YbaB/EbfC family protein
MGKGKKAKRGPLGMMGQVQQLQKELAQAQTALAEATVESSAGGGAVRVVMTGTQECREVLIDPSLLEAGDVEMLQDLMVLAVNQAIQDSQHLAAEMLGPLAGGLGLFGTA